MSDAILGPVFAERLTTLANALGRSLPAAEARLTAENNLTTANCLSTANDLAAQLAGVINCTSQPEVWLALAVLSGRLPTEELVTETLETAALNPNAVFQAAAAFATPSSLSRNVRVVTDQILVDVAHTVTTTLTTGIQRVTRECAARWAEHPETLFIQFVYGDRSYRTLTPAEYFCLLHAARDPELSDEIADCDIIVPWHASYFSPELPADIERAPVLRGISQCSPNFVGVIGHDAIPITTGETTVPDMPARFALYMGALREADLIIGTCRSSAGEFQGWRDMIRAVGIPGPEIEIVRLPVEAGAVALDTIETLRNRLTLPGIPMVLVVGSHEPRKNHLAVLFAAEALWAQGLEFSLTFIGGHSWKSEEFFAEAERLRKAGHPLELLTRVTDDLLWGAYRLARFTVFPSLNEGFGLPVAESLAVGTPTITSDFGSMREIAEDGGALYVDPRDDDSLIAAMRALLNDDELLTKLQTEASRRTNRTWVQFADEIWELLKSKTYKNSN